MAALFFGTTHIKAGGFDPGVTGVSPYWSGFSAIFFGNGDTTADTSHKSVFVV